MTTDGKQIAALFATCDAATARLGKAVRARLRARLRGLFELVYHYARQGSVVLSYSPTAAGADGVCSLALYPGEVRLYFARRALPAKDPSGLLKGQGKAVRYVVIGSPADLARPEVEAWISAAAGLVRPTATTGAKGAVVLKVDEQKQRARRARATKRPAMGRRQA